MAIPNNLSDAADAAVLLTGVTGFLGRELLYQLLTETRADLICLVRAHDEAAAQARLRTVAEELFGAEGWNQARRRVHAVRGDVIRSRLGLDRRTHSQLVRRITHVLHGAASVRFDMSITDARRINARGAIAIVDFAHAAHEHGRLRRLGYISTAFVGGSHPDRFGEDDLDVGQKFRNSYEQSKFEAELVMHAHMRNLPITVLRPSIIVGHSQSGATSAFNVIYWPLRVFADGMLRYAPAPPTLPVDVVPVDFVARGVIEALFNGEAGSTYALAAGEAATSAGAIGDIAARVFDVSPPHFISGPWLRVLLPAVNPILRLGPWRRFGNAARQYLPYFGQGSRFDTRHADALLRPRGVEPPPASQVLVPVLEFAKSTDFGRNRKAIAAQERALRSQRQRALTRASTGRQPRARRPVTVG